MQLVAAKDIIAAVESATAEVSKNAESYPIFAAMMSDINVIILQQARSALRRTDDLLKEAISANPDRKTDEVETLTTAVKTALVDLT